MGGQAPKTPRIVRDELVRSRIDDLDYPTQVAADAAIRSGPIARSYGGRTRLRSSATARNGRCGGRRSAVALSSIAVLAPSAPWRPWAGEVDADKPPALFEGLRREPHRKGESRPRSATPAATETTAARARRATTGAAGGAWKARSRPMAEQHKAESARRGSHLNDQPRRADPPRRSREEICAALDRAIDWRQQWQLECAARKTGSVRPPGHSQGFPPRFGNAFCEKNSARGSRAVSAGRESSEEFDHPTPVLRFALVANDLWMVGKRRQQWPHPGVVRDEPDHHRRGVCHDLRLVDRRGRPVVGPHPIGPESPQGRSTGRRRVEGKAGQALELEHACLDHKASG